MIPLSCFYAVHRRLVSASLAVGLLLVSIPTAFPAQNESKPASGARASSTTRVSFNKKYSIELAKGWTRVVEDNSGPLVAEGPDGATLTGTTIMTRKSLQESIQDDLRNREKAPGYDLVDEDPVTTRAGLKGVIVLYTQNNRTGGTMAVAKAYFETARNEIVGLTFTFPDGASWKSQNASVNTMYESLEVSE